jgi:hypothetical protein
MKQWLISHLFKPRTKSTDAEFKQFRSAVVEMAAQQDAEATLQLLRDGGAVLTVDKPEVGETIVGPLKSLNDVSVSGISNPVEIFVKGRLQKTTSAK